MCARREHVLSPACCCWCSVPMEMRGRVALGRSAWTVPGAGFARPSAEVGMNRGTGCQQRCVPRPVAVASGVCSTDHDAAKVGAGKIPHGGTPEFLVNGHRWGRQQGGTGSAESLGRRTKRAASCEAALFSLSPSNQFFNPPPRAVRCRCGCPRRGSRGTFRWPACPQDPCWCLRYHPVPGWSVPLPACR